MANYDIKIIDKGSPLEAIIAGIKVAKALQLEILFIDFREGFSLGVSRESRENDIANIYNLTLENKKLKEKEREEK